ncbi:MAG: hypothetical protein ABL907_19660 [Hyphomicrobium sp.]
MTLVANPNGLLIASTLFALAGIAVLAKTMLAPDSASETAAAKQRRHNEARVASWFGLPMLGGAAFLHGVGQFVSGPLGAGLVCLLLALALTLACYAALESSLADGLGSAAADNGVSLEQPRRPVSQPPKLKAVETHDATGDVDDGARQALPI